MTVPQVLAALGFLVCLALLVHHGLGARRQARLATWWRVRTASLRLAWLKRRQRWQARRSQRRLQQVPRRPGPAPRRQREPAAQDEGARTQGDAEREAADLIERARRGSGSSGNVIRPRQFEERRKGPPRDLH